MDLAAWLFAHADDWLSGRPGAGTLEWLATVADETDLPPDFLTYVAPALVFCADARIRRLGLQAHATAVQVESEQRRACLELSAALDRAGIPHVFVKGSDLRYRLYPDPSRRHSNDVDLLVRPESARGAVEAWVAAGGELRGDPSSFVGGRYHEIEGSLRGVSVDLHATLVQAGRSRYESRDVIGRRESISIEGGALPVPSREDSLALVLIHIGRHEGGSEYVGFKHGLDVLLACERWKDLDWERIGANAASWRCRRLAGAGLWTWLRAFGDRIPAAALRCLDPGFLQRRLATRTRGVLAQPGLRARGVRRLSQLGRKLAFAEGWPERLWLLRELLRRGRRRLG